MTEDRTQAEALRIAHARLEKLGWNYSHADVGKVARDIIDAMKLEPAALRKSQGER